MAHVPELEEQAVLRTDSCTDSVDEAPAQPRRLVFTVAAGGAAALVLACGALWAASGAAGPSHVTARQMMESPETAAIIADNIMTLGGHNPSEKGAIREAVDKGIQKKMTVLRQDLAKYERLSNLELSEAEKHRFLSQLRRKGDKRLYRIRDEIMTAIKTTVDESGDHEALKRHIAENLQPHVAEMRELNDAYFPDHQKIAKDMTLQPDHFARMRMVTTFDELRKQLKEPVARKLLYGSTGTTAASSSGTGIFDDMFSGSGDMNTQIQQAMDEMESSFNSMFGMSSTYNPASDDPMSCMFAAMTGGTLSTTGGAVDSNTCMDEAVQSMNLSPDMQEFFGITTTQPGVVSQVSNLLR